MDFNCIIKHKIKPISGLLTALRGKINSPRLDKEVQLYGNWTGEKLKDFEEVKPAEEFECIYERFKDNLKVKYSHRD